MSHSLISFIANYALFISIIVALFVFLSLDNRAKRLQFVIWGLAGAVVLILLARLGSWLYYNPRPFVVGHFTPYFPHPNNNGFPSDHTLFTSYLAFFVLKYNRRLGIVLLVVAAAIGLARVIAGVHHLVDIIAAFALSGITVFAMEYCQKINNPRKARTE